MGNIKVQAMLVLACLLAAGALVAPALLRTDGRVFLYNSNDREVEVRVDGDLVAVLGPGQSFVQPLRAGNDYEVDVTGDGIDQAGTLDLPSVAIFGGQYSGLYVIGPARQFAVVTTEYGDLIRVGPAPTPEIIVPEPGQLFDLPEDITGEGINHPFPISVEVEIGQDTAELVHLCTWDPDQLVDGCN